MSLDPCTKERNIIPRTCNVIVKPTKRSHSSNYLQQPLCRSIAKCIIRVLVSPSQTPNNNNNNNNDDDDDRKTRKERSRLLDGKYCQCACK